MTEETVPSQVRKWYSDMGKKGGGKLFKERGPEYYSRIAKMRKNPGRKKKVVETPPENENG